MQYYYDHFRFMKSLKANYSKDTVFCVALNTYYFGEFYIFCILFNT